VDDRSQVGRQHVFAINASAAFLNVVRDLFQEEDYEVTTSNIVPTSFAQIAAAQPDALIVDLVPGEQAGLELLERLHTDAVTTGIPVLVCSTNPRLLEQAQAQAERYGTHRYLAKPFDVDALLTHVQAMTGESR
jgi:twitching motility two-component system response regulator PilH